MARLTYGFLAAAGVALVSGFFVHGSSLPLLASITFSVAVTALISYGWSRRLREGELESSPDDSVEDIDIDRPEKKTSGRGRTRPKLEDTATLDVFDDSVFAPRPTRRRAKAKSKSRPKAKTSRAKSASVKKVAARKPQAKKSPPPKRAAARKPPAPRPAPRPAHRKVKATVKRVAVVPGASRYHRRGCRFAQSPAVRMVPESVAIERGYLACEVCKP